MLSLALLLPAAALAGPLHAEGLPVPIVGLCEPSGAALGPDGVAWIVDDDQDGAVFRWVPGQGETLRLPLPAPPGGDVPKDAEGVAMRADGTLWVMGSHALSKKGKLGDRALVLRVARTPDDAVVVAASDGLRPEKGPGGLAALDAGLRAVCGDCGLPPDAAGAAEGRAFDLEGLALLEPATLPRLGGPAGLYFGLRAPLLGEDALVFRMDADAAVAHPTHPVPVDAAWRLPLGGRGVRALSPAQGGGLLIVAGPAGKDDDQGVGAALYHWMPGALPALLGALPPGPDGMWVEAVVSVGPREAFVIYDEGGHLSRDQSWHRDAAGDFACGAGDPPGHAWARAQRLWW